MFSLETHGRPDGSGQGLAGRSPPGKRRAPAEDAHSPRLSRASSSRFPRRLTHELIQAYQLPKHMRVCTLGQQWQPATADELNRFHTDQYVDFLQQLTSNAVNVAHEAPNHVLNQSVMFTESAWNYSTVYAGASMAAVGFISGLLCLWALTA